MNNNNTAGEEKPTGVIKRVRIVEAQYGYKRGAELRVVQSNDLHWWYVLGDDKQIRKAYCEIVLTEPTEIFIPDATHSPEPSRLTAEAMLKPLSKYSDYYHKSDIITAMQDFAAQEVKVETAEKDKRISELEGLIESFQKETHQIGK